LLHRAVFIMLYAVMSLLSGWFDKSFRNSVFLLLLLITAIGVSPMAVAGEFSIYGPLTYLRTTGSPVAVESQFSVTNPTIPYTLKIYNGGLEDDDFDQVSASVIFLNGTEVLSPNELNQTVSYIEKPVPLQALNDLTVEVRGKPGGALVIEIVGIDDTSPTITATATPLPNVAGWNNTDVIVNFICDDAISGILTCPEPITITTDGSGQIVSGTAEDNAGNTATTSVTVNIDRTVPSISSGINPAANVAGWHKSDATVSFTCTDLLSGVADCTQPVVVGTEGIAQPVNGSATDVAGNTSQTTTAINLDKTAPTIAATIAPAANLNGWHNGDVTVSFVCTDLLSGIDTCPAPVVITAEGFGQVVSRSVSDKAGNTATTSVTLNIDKTLPSLTIGAPAPGSVQVINPPSIDVSYSDANGVDVATLSFELDGQLLTVVCSKTSTSSNCMAATDFSYGTHTLQATVSDVAGNTAVSQVTFEQAIPDTDGDGVQDTSDLCPGTTAGETVDANGCALSQLDSDSDGVFDADDQCPNTLVGEAVDASGCSAAQQTEPLPEDPATVAPALDPTISTTLAAATEFLYTGTNPIQTGVSAGTIEVYRAAVLRGQVTDRDNNPLSGVTVTIHNHPEFGQTLTRVDGMFDMAVNGGGLLTVNYVKDGYLPIQRQIDTPWADYAIADTVVMIPLDAQVTTIDLTDTTQAFQVAQGSPVTDIDGTRQATMLFPQGITATMTLPDGSTQTLTTLNVRASEYTVGDNGPQAMPGELPATSAYTYAVELSVDEAIAVGATRVDFDQPVPFYVDNFLNFPVGEIVPAGWYDREKVAWIPSDNGRIIGILAINAGMADLDIDGSGIAADAAQLAGLGITDAERVRLASLYAVGKSLWRTPVTHFTPWDCNWPYGPPSDATPPPPPPVDDNTPDEDEDCERGCIIQPQSQSLGEIIPVAGTPFNLRYQSERMLNNVNLTVLLSGDTVPGSLKSIELTIGIAGKIFKKSFPPEPNQSFTYVWDGNDVFGRPAAAKTATISLDYRYKLVYFSARSGFASSFARATDDGAAFLGSRGNRSMRVRQQWQQQLIGSTGSPSLASSALGGWGFDILNAYDTTSLTLYKGDGAVRSAEPVISDGIIDTVAGIGVKGFSGDGGLATRAEISDPFAIAIKADGTMYIAEISGNRIRRISPEGVITTIAGTGEWGFSGDDGPAVEAKLAGPQSVAISSDGSIYFSDFSNSRIRRIDPDGIITTVVNQSANSIAIGPDDSLYYVFLNSIRRIGTDGSVDTIAGVWYASGYSGDGGLATQARLNYPEGLAIGLNGGIYIADTYNNVT